MPIFLYLSAEGLIRPLANNSMLKSRPINNESFSGSLPRLYRGRIGIFYYRILFLNGQEILKHQEIIIFREEM